MTDHMYLEVEIEWSVAGQVTTHEDDLNVPQLDRAPGVYQWVFRHDGRERRYVGEAIDLQRRFSHYRNPGPSQSTNVRMNERARRVLSRGGSIEILLASRVVVTTGGVDAALDLSSPFTRRFVENAALIALLEERCEIVNGRGYGDLRRDEVLG